MTTSARALGLDDDADAAPRPGPRQMVRVLGPCIVDGTTEPTASGESVSVSLSVIQRSILCRLAVSAPAPVDLDELADAIWGDAPPATARTSIHNQISRIRSRLGNDAILTEPAGYSLTLTTDMTAVVALLRTAENAAAATDWETGSAIADEALAYWRGPPLEELGESVEARDVRRRMYEVRNSLESLRLEAAISFGRTGWAIPEAERLVADAPQDEHRWVLLMRALELAGRRGDALGAYERARRVLADQLGLDPGPALRAAEAQVLGTAATDRPGGSAALVGRTDVIDDALGALERGQCVVITGETGIGKTRVLDAVNRLLRRQGHTVARGFCAVNPDTAVATLVALGDELGIDMQNGSTPVSGFVDALTRHVASAGDTILAIDDLDQAGPTTIAALQAAVEVDGVMLLTTADDSRLLPPAIAARVFSLGPLPMSDLAELVPKLPGGDAADETDLQWIAEMSGGNPMLIEHLLDDPAWRDHVRADRTPDRGGRIASGALADLIRRRLERLGTTTRATLEVAAVCGPSCPEDLLVDLSGGRGIAGAVTASLLDRSPGDDNRPWLTFRHGAVQRILYDDLSPGRRMEIHHRAATLLRNAGTAAPIIAAHALASSDIDPVAATRAAIEAALAATDDGAHEDAARWYSRAVEVAARTGSTHRPFVEALVGLGDALRRTGSPDHQNALFAAADAAFDLGEADLIGDAAFALLQLGATTESGSLHEKAIELADRALAARLEPDHRARIAAAASLTHSMMGDAHRCRELFLEAERLGGTSATRRHVLPFAYLGIGHPADLEHRERLTDELLELAREAEDPVAIFEGLQLSFSVGLQRARGDQVRAAVAEADGLIDRVGDVGRQWSIAYQHAAVAHLDGDLETAERKADEALGLFASVSPSRAVAAYGGQMLVVRLAQGRLDELTESIENLVTDQPRVPAWNAALALAVAHDDPDRAQAHASAALDGVDEDFTWLAAHLIGGRAAAIAGDEITRGRYVERLERWSGLVCWQGTCSYGPVDTVLGLLAQSDGRTEAAARHFAAARQQAHSLGAPVFTHDLDAIESPGGS